MHNWKREASLLLILLLAACGSATPPEERVRAFLAQTEAFAENREYAALVDRIAGDYLDRRGNDKRAAAAILRGFFLRNRAVHLLVRIDSIALPTPKHAVAVVYVAIGQRPFNESALPDADIFRVELELAATGDGYEILQASFERASAAEAVF